LKIEAAEVAGDVDDFADEVQARDFSRFHGFAGEFTGVDAAGSDFGFGVAFGACGEDWKGVESFFESGERGVGPRGRSVESEPARGEAFWEEVECSAYRGRGARGGGAE